ncbi:amidase family protein [Roseomonas chloroacetimidivorans]|uniref:amidase family protein n=1 Tax=Roseomonas chloroacetimidivorans TaxID=1766656 RepID=UPI003C710362
MNTRATTKHNEADDSRPLDEAPLGRRAVLGTGAALLLSSGAEAQTRAGPIFDAGPTSWTATAAIRRIRNGDIKAEDYVRALLREYERHRSLNAVTWINDDRALEAARSIDTRRAQGGELPPLAGLPLIVKDNIATIGFPTSAGTPALRGAVARSNAPVMQTLLDAGALVLCKGNMHELAVGGTSSNPAFGVVRNPYDPGRIPGGSSGGVAAAIAARFCPAGLGTDTAGSVRIPAAFCGIAALRPTTAGDRRLSRYSLDGVVPLVLTLDTIGPMARSVEDVALLDATITGRPRPERAGLRGLRLGIPRIPYWEAVDPEVSQVLEASLAQLRERGVELVSVEMADLIARANDLYVTLYNGGFVHDLEAYLASAAPEVSLDAVMAGLSSPDVRARFGALRAPTTPRETVAQALATVQPQLARDYAERLRAAGVEAVAFPTEPLVAPLIRDGGDSYDDEIEVGGRKVGRMAIVIRNTRPTGGIGVPGVSIPAGLSASGLPVGLELDGLPGQDARLLGIGMALEDALGPLPPPDPMRLRR